jgi:uncharacterized Ntn-hydrolase superfamily protein
MRLLALLAVLAALPSAAAAPAGSAAPAGPAAAPAPRGRPVHTYSIVARDPATGQLGVAVQSHWFAVGQSVPWAEAGVGAVATQSFVDPTYGKRGLDLMREGRPAPDALAELVAKDGGRAVRQVAMVDAQGRVAVHTGEGCIAEAGHRQGQGYSVQANMMLHGTVPDAMAKAFEGAKGDLAERMLAALEAAERAGGDVRGKQAAALVVVPGTSGGRPWAERLFDVRVDDHPRPLAELRRLVGIQRAYVHMNRGDVAMEKADHAAALREYAQAERLYAGNPEMTYWHAVGLVNAGRVESALPLFRRVFAKDRNWATLTRRLVDAGQLPKDPALLARILGQAPGAPGR